MKRVMIRVKYPWQKRLATGIPMEGGILIPYPQTPRGHHAYLRGLPD